MSVTLKGDGLWMIGDASSAPSLFVDDTLAIGFDCCEFADSECVGNVAFGILIAICVDGDCDGLLAIGLAKGASSEV
eukprot:CAMPEP_0201593806 /NCGR_PEP_ID=MMETSP0190_2-20130828/191317_1 /ASSEMBLY_ACC=CAM_ASM_000263 /TAXON_ID=37353 /ORGANISM="Rosalina sp." /LENGTH=76 /DNA_ID=CAMNT_0048053173 /DNA_START=832 /DNA_END=1062 /DNA_ORIENTATION=-